MMQYQTELETTIHDMVQKGRGVLAADESAPTVAKRFKAIGVESTEENRLAWRRLLVTTKGLGQYISGIILFEETLEQKTDKGDTIPAAAWSQNIVPGIKVDKGKTPLALSAGDLITQGLDGLAERLRIYKTQGARFAKWRTCLASTRRTVYRLSTSFIHNEVSYPPVGSRTNKALAFISPVCSKAVMRYSKPASSFETSNGVSTPSAQTAIEYFPTSRPTKCSNCAILLILSCVRGSPPCNCTDQGRKAGATSLRT